MAAKKSGFTKTNSLELEPSQLRWACSTEFFKFNTTKELEPLNSIVGQPRAIEAIRLGAELDATGYNIFVTGLSGTGRLSTVKSILEEVTTYKPNPSDYCYVNNFENSDQPVLISLPGGTGKKFVKEMDETIQLLRSRLPKLFEEENYQQARQNLAEQYQKREQELLDEFDERLKPIFFVRGQIESDQGTIQPEIFPMVEGKPVNIENLDELVAKQKITAEQAKEFRENYKELRKELYEIARHGLKMMQEYRKELAQIDQETANMLVNSAFEDILDHFKVEKVKIYLDQVKKFILDNLSIFVKNSNNPAAAMVQQDSKADPEKFMVFQVNQILENKNYEKPPVKIETIPTYSNLFGTIERVMDSRGIWRSDFTKIKAGSLLEADQGFLIVNALDLFSEPYVWTTLKRVLLYSKLEIQPMESLYQMSQSHLKPEPIDIKVKVIIIGGQTLYRYLYHNEKGFKKIFKIQAQFDYEIERTEGMLENYARFIAMLCEQENLPPLTPDGVCGVIEWAVERAGSQNRVTLKFSEVADIVREAAFYDRKYTQDGVINRTDVDKAIAWRRFRNDMIDEKVRNQILQGYMFIDTTGERVGQINGLTVMFNGLLSFGKPARITANISPGTAGIINIEREVNMSGAIHNKGVLIITGLFREWFAFKHPLSFTGSIAFEQSYGGIDGDSASAAEIYVLLSAITQIPIKQNIAITGSINQKGDIQPIGGVNEKIQGFYEICKARGFTGDQGVIIPGQNVKDLMLCPDIINDVSKGNFHIYAINRIEEGTELLMGKKAGQRTKTNDYTKGSLFDLAQKRMDEFYETSKKRLTPSKTQSKQSKTKKS